jgi:hypothetical protein
MAELHVDGEEINFIPDRMINAGYSGRDKEAVQDHINELVKEGIDAPSSVPTMYEVSPYTLLVDPDSISVIGDQTSGEAEVGLFVTGRDIYVVVASDHTDRELETESIQKAKQITPNVVSQQGWRFEDIQDHWDKLALRAWNTVDGEQKLHQDTTLGAILEPKTLLDEVRDRYGKALNGTALLSGTVGTISGELTPGSRFEVQLRDPVQDRSLAVAYNINQI